MSENLPDTNVGNIEYISKADAVNAVEFGITLASAINIETGERTELFQRENDELREAVKRIKDIESADVAPVVHGRWLPIVSYNNTYKCSECGRLLVDITDGLKMVAKHYPYCHCGAKMDGGDEHG